jgi:hypothetical protein
MDEVIKLTWLPHWKAYCVRRAGRMVGMVVCKQPLPFRNPVQYA